MRTKERPAHEQLAEFVKKKGWSTRAAGAAFNCSATAAADYIAGRAVPHRYVIRSSMDTLAGISPSLWDTNP